MILALCLAAPASANLPLGACCLADGCIDVQVLQCDADGGDFLGEGTACADVECGRSVAAPMLSIAGLIAALGALGGLGAWRLVRRRGRA
jgi:hypothetical protein